MGKKIENYVLDNMVGQGEFGKVYKAINEKNNQVVAIKIIRVQKFKMSPKLEEFTINEIQTLSKIQDTTHVVRFIQILKTANNYYFVYEFCNGGTLDEQIKREGRFPEEKALGYFKDLMKAFQILTKFNIMHRDIKPSNILLHNGTIKLADFGFCKPLKDARDLSQTMLGSPIYMAPEVLKGEVYTMKADIWSLGVVLYEMLYGFCPFEEKTIARLISLIDEATVIFPSNTKISKKTQDLLKKMLVKDHFKRIGWEELLSIDFAPQNEEEKCKSVGNPFSKKATLTSIVTEQARNRYLNPSQSYKPEAFKQNTASTPTNALNSNTNVYNMRKKQSKAILSAGEKKYIQTCLDNRSKIYQGLKLLKSIIHENSSKSAIIICSFLSKKIKSINRENGDILKKIPMGQENKDKANDPKKIIAMLEDQRSKVQDKLTPFQSQLEHIKEPLDILFLKFAEEEGLTQQKQGLLQLIQIYDFINNQKQSDLSKSSKKELLEQYQARIFKKT